MAADGAAVLLISHDDDLLALAAHEELALAPLSDSRVSAPARTGLP